MIFITISKHLYKTESVRTKWVRGHGMPVPVCTKWVCMPVPVCTKCVCMPVPVCTKWVRMHVPVCTKWVSMHVPVVKVSMDLGKLGGSVVVEFPIAKHGSLWLVYLYMNHDSSSSSNSTSNSSPPIQTPNLPRFKTRR